MTDLRKAADMALEALEFSLPAIEDFGSKEQLTDCHRAIMALYKALAQPEQVSIEPPDYVEPITFDYHEGWEEGFKAGVGSAKNKKESTPSNVDPLLHGGDGNYIKQAQPEQEPVAYIDHVSGKPKFIDGYVVQTNYDIPLYTAPPKREWVGLTDDEIEHLRNDQPWWMVRDIEAKLKEKNNGST
jgi:hypothetical protein